MKQEFLNFVQKLMEANPELTKQLMSDNVQAYLDILKDIKDEKPLLTENGKAVLLFMRNHPETRLWKSKDLAEQMGISSRGASGSMRKLVNDGFCEKLGKDPVIYSLTEYGKTYEIIEGENE